ncbi:hypothetical protein [Cetobacterium ceti]
MKKILFGLLALSSLSFTQQDVNKAQIEVHVFATVNTIPSTQISIVDESGKNTMNDLILLHGDVDSSNISDHTATRTFRVRRGNDTEAVDFPHDSHLNFALDNKNLSLDNDKGAEIPGIFNELPSIIKPKGNLTDLITLTHTLKPTDPNNLIGGRYYGGTLLTVTLNKTKTTPQP